MVRHSDLANVEVSGQSLSRPRVLGLALEQALKAFLVGASLPPACATVVFGLVQPESSPAVFPSFQL